MQERVAGDSLGDPGKGGGLLHAPLKHRFVEVVAIQVPGSGILPILQRHRRFEPEIP